MDDSFILSLSPHVATRIKENSESQKVELQASREHAKRECTLVVKDITSRLSTSDGHEFVEIWKSFDGVHSLKSSDVQYLTQRAKQSEEEQPDHSSRNNRAQHCELADSNSIQQTKLVERTPEVMFRAKKDAFGLVIFTLKVYDLGRFEHGNKAPRLKRRGFEARVRGHDPDDSGKS